MKAILFDLDGTLLDSEGVATQANRHGFETVLRRQPTPEEEAGLTGVPVPKVLAEWFPQQGPQIFEQILVYYEQHADQVRPYLGILEMIAELHRSGYVLGIVSSKKRRYVLRELEAAGLNRFFPVVVGQEDTSEHKPNPAPLLLAAEQLGITPECCVYVGDQPTDIQAAQAAGMWSVATYWGEGRKERLAPYEPTFSSEIPIELITLALDEWHAEGTVARYIRTIREKYPDLPILSVEVNATGQNNDVLLVNGDLIFRFPKYERAINRMIVEVEILKTIYGLVPVKTPLPIYLADNQLQQTTFMGYRLIPGQPLTRESVSIMSNDEQRHIAAQLGKFLHSLHAISVESIRALLPNNDLRTEWRTMYKEIQMKLFPYMRPDARETVRCHFESYLENSENFEFTSALIHGDFGTTNLLIAPGTADITGVIDFGAARIGDPAIDFAGLLAQYGEDFLSACRHTYPNLDEMLPRSRFYAGTFALQEALFGIDNGDNVAFQNGMKDYS